MGFSDQIFDSFINFLSVFYASCPKFVVLFLFFQVKVSVFPGVLGCNLFMLRFIAKKFLFFGCVRSVK